MSVNTSVRVGVVIPNHNYGKWIDKAIMSVVNEPYPNKKIVVVDDGSTDSSWPIICKILGLKDIRQGKVLTGKVEDITAYAYRFPTAGGPSRARNTGIKILWEETDLYGMLDSDDEYRPGKLTLSVEKFLTDPMNIGAIYTDYDTLNEETGLMLREYKEPFSRERLVQECIVHSACVINKMVFDKIGYYDENLRVAEDYDLWMRISENFCLIHIPEPLMLVRVGSHNSTATVKSEIWRQNWQRVMLKAQARANGR